MAALVALAVACVACNDGGTVVTGIVIDVQQSGPADVEGFTLRTDDGRLLGFTVGPDTVAAGGTFPAVHLRDHLASGQPIVVRYVAGKDGLVAIRLADAP